MSRTPAARLARLKVAYRDWTVQAGHGSEGYTVTAFRRDEHGGQLLMARSPEGLELQLLELGEKPGMDELRGRPLAR